MDRIAREVGIQVFAPCRPFTSRTDQQEKNEKGIRIGTGSRNRVSGYFLGRERNEKYISNIIDVKIGTMTDRGCFPDEKETRVIGAQIMEFQELSQNPIFAGPMKNGQRYSETLG